MSNRSTLYWKLYAQIFLFYSGTLSLVNIFETITCIKLQLLRGAVVPGGRLSWFPGLSWQFAPTENGDGLASSSWLINSKHDNQVFTSFSIFLHWLISIPYMHIARGKVIGLFKCTHKNTNLDLRISCQWCQTDDNGKNLATWTYAYTCECEAQK